MTTVAIAAGGALGALMRYFVAVRVYNFLGVSVPFGTLTVNLGGCFLLGLTMALIEERSAFGPETRSFLTIGFLGGMTTFSTFVYEGWDFLRSDEPFKSGIYVFGSVLGALILFSIGRLIPRLLES